MTVIARRQRRPRRVADERLPMKLVGRSEQRGVERAPTFGGRPRAE
jgi:hypothetical protein